MTNTMTRVMRFAVLTALLLTFLVPAFPQKKKANRDMSGRPGLWERHDISRQDLFLGPGGEAMMPELSHITLISEEKGGYSRKFRLKDGAGQEWVKDRPRSTDRDRPRYASCPQ